MTEKINKSTLLKTESELLASKKLGKKIFLYSIAVFFGSIFLKIAFSGVLRLIAYSGIHLEINSADNIFSSFLIMISMTSFVTSLIGGSLWVETLRSKFSNEGFVRHSNLASSSSSHLHINDSLNPISYNYRSRH